MLPKRIKAPTGALAVLLAWVLVLTSCGSGGRLGQEPSTPPGPATYARATTDASGNAVLELAGQRIQARVLDETASPVDGATVEAFVVNNSILVVAGSDDHYPALRVVSTSATRLRPSGEARRQVALISLAMTVVAVAGIASVIYDYVRNPEEFPIQIRDVLHGEHRVRAVCVEVDASDLLNLYTVISGFATVYAAGQVFGAPAKLRGVTAIKFGLTRKKLTEVTAIHAVTEITRVLDILNDDIVARCFHYYETVGGAAPMAYMTLEVTPNLAGRWTGTWSSRTGASGGVEAVIEQAGRVLGGRATITGSPCFTSGSISGEARGAEAVLGVLFAGNEEARFSGEVVGSRSSLSGRYSVNGGACHGDSGSFSLRRATTP